MNEGGLQGELPNHHHNLKEHVSNMNAILTYVSSKKICRYLDLENLFLCEDQNCKNRVVSIKYFDSVNKKIRCSCGKKEYDWKG